MVWAQKLKELILWKSYAPMLCMLRPCHFPYHHRIISFILISSYKILHQYSTKTWTKKICVVFVRSVTCFVLKHEKICAFHVFKWCKRKGFLNIRKLEEMTGRILMNRKYYLYSVQIIHFNVSNGNLISEFTQTQNKLPERIIICTK